MYRPSFKFHRSKESAEKIREEFSRNKRGESAGAGARKSQTEGNVLKEKRKEIWILVANFPPAGDKGILLTFVMLSSFPFFLSDRIVPGRCVTWGLLLLGKRRPKRMRNEYLPADIHRENLIRRMTEIPERSLLP